MNSVLQHDFCPWANRYVYWLKYPLAQLALATIAALCIGIWVVPQGFVAFGGLLIVIVTGLCWPLLALRPVTAVLNFQQPRTTEGEPVLATLTIQNGWPWPLWGLVLEGGFCGEEWHADETIDRNIEVGLAGIPGWSSVDFTWRFTPDCRGKYPLTSS